MKKKILHIAPAFHKQGGGIYEVVENLSLAQSEIESIEINILCIDNNSKKIHDERILLDYLPRRFTDIIKIIKTLNFFYKTIFSFDVIHLHGAWSPQFILLLPFVFKCRNKIIFQPHGLLDPIRSRKSWYKKKIAWYLYQMYLINTSTRIIACSEKEKIELKALLKYENKISIIPNGIDKIFFESKNIKNIREEKRILFLSQIIPIKNIEILINLIAILKFKYNIELFLDIYGYGKLDYIKKLQFLVQDLNVKDNIIFKGSIERENRINVYDSYKYFILPSLSENFAIVILEALSRGCIVITSDMTPWSNFKHKNLVITNVSINSLVETIQHVMNDLMSINYNESTKNILDIADYKWEAIALKFDTCYDEILNY